MRIQSLAGLWEFCQSGSNEWLPANVPGGVHTDLMANGRIPDPFVGDNERRVQWVAENDWMYRKRFSCSADLLAEERIYLVCDGLDTLAEVNINGHVLGKTDNMFRRYEWEVKSFLNASDDNLLTITFASPVRFIANKNIQREMISPYHSIHGGPYLRKAPCQFGWDWGPRLPTIGIWKNITLEGYSKARINDVRISQDHKNGLVNIEVQVNVERWGKNPLNVEVIVDGKMDNPDNRGFQPESEISSTGEAIIKGTISKPALWWPNGYGDQSLYNVIVRLENNIDYKEYKLGLRTIELRQQEDQWGRCFTFVVNGVPILAKGSNWIPADSFPTRITRDALDRLMRDAALSHQNMLRGWGGGFYEAERFYDLCDQYGILVWQEFIFACSIYPLNDPEFVANIHEEAIQNIRRLRHRASLALWCGNNEMEEGWLDWNWDTPEHQDLKDAYDRFFHHTLREWCLAEDPDHSYWPSSPSSNIPFLEANGQRQGDTHYWDVWHKGQPFTAYRAQYPRFMSEFGFQSLPPLETIRTYAGEKDWNMTSYIMEQHQKNANGNAMIIRQMLDTFRLPKDFESLVYLSMVLQAEGIRYGVEHWRRHPDRVAGILYWQLNDCWPVASWSSLDYFGRWKALHYAARRFYAPVMLSIEDNPPEMSVYVSNDLLTEWNGSVEWSLETRDGKSLRHGKSPVQAGPQSATQVCKLDFSENINIDTIRKLVFVAGLIHDDQVVTYQVTPFVPIKHLELQTPAFKIQALHLPAEQLDPVTGDELEINLEAGTLALMVELSLAGAEVVFSDNYFSLAAGRKRRVTCPMPVGWDIDRVRQALRIRSVYDSYEHPKEG